MPPHPPPASCAEHYQNGGDPCNIVLACHVICGAMLRTELVILAHCAPVAVRFIASGITLDRSDLGPADPPV